MTVSHRRTVGYCRHFLSPTKRFWIHSHETLHNWTRRQEVQFGAHFRRSVAQLRRHGGFLEGGFGERDDFTAAARVERVNSANLWTGETIEKRK